MRRDELRLSRPVAKRAKRIQRGWTPQERESRKAFKLEAFRIPLITGFNPEQQTEVDKNVDS